jgi:zinc transport system ATP-binding protein
VQLTPLLELRHASFGYAERVVVEDVSFSLAAGEVVALLGPNGSGKSTLVRGLLGLVPLLGGAVDLFGTPLAEVTERTRIGYVPQRHTLSTAVRATVREIVATGRLPHRPWWRPAGTRDHELVESALDQVGLADRAGHEVSTLSGGQQRRVLIARALAAEPEVLVMDEPTAGVDTASQVVLSRVLARLAESGTSMLVVTHELDALEDVATRIMCLDHGHIDFDGDRRAYAAAQDRGEHHGGGSGHHHESHDVPPLTGLGPVPLGRGGVH